MREMEFLLMLRSASAVTEAAVIYLVELVRAWGKKSRIPATVPDASLLQ